MDSVIKVNSTKSDIVPCLYAQTESKKAELIMTGKEIFESIRSLRMPGQYIMIEIFYFLVSQKKNGSEE